MKKLILICTVISLIATSCATIVGGSKYNAFISVNDNNNANITYNGTKIGVGSATLKIPRKKAKALSFEVSQNGCPSETFTFSGNKIRGWALAGSIIMTPSFGTDEEGRGGVPIPIWVILDAATGALVKPDDSDQRITKGDYNNFYYNLPYSCKKEAKPSSDFEEEELKQENNTAKTKEQKLIELKELYDKGMITQSEYEKSRQAILNQ